MSVLVTERDLRTGNACGANEASVVEVSERDVSAAMAVSINVSYAHEEYDGQGRTLQAQARFEQQVDELEPAQPWTVDDHVPQDIHHPPFGARRLGNDWVSHDDAPAHDAQCVDIPRDVGARPDEADERDGVGVGRDEGRLKEKGLGRVGQAATRERQVRQRARKPEREAYRRVSYDLVEQLARQVDQGRRHGRPGLVEALPRQLTLRRLTTRMRATRDRRARATLIAQSRSSVG